MSMLPDVHFGHTHCPWLKCYYLDLLTVFLISEIYTDCAWRCLLSLQAQFPLTWAAFLYIPPEWMPFSPPVFPLHSSHVPQHGMHLLPPSFSLLPWGFNSLQGRPQFLNACWINQWIIYHQWSRCCLMASKEARMGAPEQWGKDHRFLQDLYFRGGWPDAELFSKNVDLRQQFLRCGLRPTPASTESLWEM